MYTIDMYISDANFCSPGHAGSSTGSHSLLLQEYTITPRLLVFDTRGLSVGNTGENVALLKDWVQHGVADSQAVIRSSDGRESREAIQVRNFVGFVSLALRFQVKDSKSLRGFPLLPGRTRAC